MWCLLIVVSKCRQQPKQDTARVSREEEEEEELTRCPSVVVSKHRWQPKKDVASREEEEEELTVLQRRQQQRHTCTCCCRLCALVVAGHLCQSSGQKGGEAETRTVCVHSHWKTSPNTNSRRSGSNNRNDRNIENCSCGKPTSFGRWDHVQPVCNSTKSIRKSWDKKKWEHLQVGQEEGRNIISH